VLQVGVVGADVHSEQVLIARGGTVGPHVEGTISDNGVAAATEA
jgi:hypothetical protein